MAMLSLSQRRRWSMQKSCRPPQQIILDTNAKPIQDVERQIERRRDKDEIEYLKDVVSKEQEKVETWKGVARKMQSAIDYLECRVSTLEHDAYMGNKGSGGDGGCGGGDALRRSSSPSSSEASLRRVSTSSSSSSQASLRLSTSTNPQSSSTPPPSLSSPQSSAKKNDATMQRKKDAIVLELVTEMSRLMALRTNASSSSSGDQQGEEDNAIDTSALEDIVMQALERGQDTRKKKKKKKQKEQQDVQGLYQLSCLHCVGANFIDSTNQSDLLDKVKDHYSVVWEVVQLAYKEGGDGDDNGVIGAVEGLLVKNDNDSDKSSNEEQIAFRASSFLHHIARHCRK